MSDRRQNILIALGLPALIGILFFGVLMGVSMALVMLNARVSPALPWFPLPVIALLFAAAVWAERRWHIGFSTPLKVSAGRATVLAIAAAVLGVTACILQGALHDFVRETEGVPEGVTGTFAFVYVLLMSGVAGVLAEVTFRGIVQTSWHARLRPWTVIVLVTLLNFAAHRWGEWMLDQWAGYLVALGALTWLRWATGSLWPPLIAHVVFNLGLALAHTRYGAFDHGNISAATLWAVGAVGGFSLVVAALLAPRAGGMASDQRRPATVG